MNRRTIVPILLVCTFALLAPRPALADFTDLEVVDRTDLTICQNQSDPEILFKLDVCEVYAVFDDPADRLISVAFSNVSTTDTNGFYQHSLNTTSNAPACALIALQPTVECDSFVTLGVDCFDFTDNTTIDPDFNAWKFNNSGEVSGGWYNSAPPNGQGDPDANGRVLMGRFSYKQNKTSSGDVCVFTQLAGSNDIIEFLLLPFDCANPGLQGVGGGGAGAGGECAPGTTVCYVDDPGAGMKDCSTWGNACGELQDALDRAASGECNEIWVAAGTYKPTKLTDPLELDLRTATFAMSSCLEIYGGFYGNEVTFGDRANLFDDTILSGDIQMQGDDFDNSYHVVVAYEVDTTAILDGFTITKGQADGTNSLPCPANQGGGLNIFGVDCTGASTPQIANCTFLENYAENHGGAVNDHGGATLTDCVFRENRAGSHGAGLYIHSDIGTTVTDCAFYDNNVALVMPGIPGKGGGVYVKENPTPPGAEPTFTDCIFSGNQAEQGGGFYSGAGRSPTIRSINSDCTFSANRVTGFIGEGAAIYIDEGSFTVSDCTFSDNETDSGNNSKGGAIYINDGSALIEGCTFTSNLGGLCGGAIYMGRFSTPTIRDCEFIDNSGATPAAHYGGAIYSEGATVAVVNCVFQDNAGKSGGAIYQLADIADFSDVPIMDMINCTFINNETTDLVVSGSTEGGAISSKDGPLVLTNCLFVGNRATSGASNACGGAVRVEQGGELIASNCTFVGNSAKTDGGGIFIGSNAAATNALDNCVFWNNTDTEIMGSNNDDESAQIHFATATAPAVTYSDFMNVVQQGPFCPDVSGDPATCDNGIIAGDPKFVAPLSGTWTADGVYCSQACWDDPVCTFCGEPEDDLEVGQSKFTTDASYTVDEHVGKLLNVNTTQTRVALIAANTATTITVWGDPTGLENQTDLYQIDDYRLQGGVGGSPCIDAADNTVVGDCDLDLDGNERFVDDPANDPDPGNGTPPFVDMGAYEFGGDPELDCNGNGMEDDCEITADPSLDCTLNGIPDECDIASGTSLDCNDNGVPDSCCTADHNGDEVVDAFDLASLLGDWGACDNCEMGTPACSCWADFNNDCDVEAFDLADLLGQWGPCP